MPSAPRILTQLPIQLLEPVVRDHPEVDIVQIPTKGPIGLEGDKGLMEYRHIQIKVD